MKLSIGILLIIVSGGAFAPAYAQDSLIGKYSGSYTSRVSSGERQTGIELTISSVEGENVKGVVMRHTQRYCRGEFPVEGNLKDNRLVLRGKGGSTEDCSITLRLTPDGNKLTGTLGSSTPVSMSK